MLVTMIEVDYIRLRCFINATKIFVKVLFPVFCNSYKKKVCIF